MDDDLTTMISALFAILGRGITVKPLVHGRPDAGWQISLAPEEEAQPAANDDRPEAWIGGLGG